MVCVILSVCIGQWFPFSVFHPVPFPTGVTKAVVCAILSASVSAFPSQYSIQSPSGARCSSVVRASAHGAMDRRIDPSRGGPIELFLVPSSPLPDWCNKGCGMCYPVCLHRSVLFLLSIPSSRVPNWCNKGRGVCYPVCLHGSVLFLVSIPSSPLPAGVIKAVVCAILSVCIGQCFPCQYSIQSPSGARCSSVVRAFGHGAMGHRIDPSWWSEM